MNSDPYDSAAWRTFNMLDADESAIFDEAMRHDPLLRSAYLEMDRLSAAIAATTAAAGRTQTRTTRTLAGPPRSQSGHRTHFWLAVSGWSAAAVLAILLTLHLTGIINRGSPEVRCHCQPPTTPPSPPTTLLKHPTTPTQRIPSMTALPNPDARPPPRRKPNGSTRKSKCSAKIWRNSKIATASSLRQVPGMALPIVMTMHPPGVTPEDPALAKNDGHSPITAMLGDALTSTDRRRGRTGGGSVRRTHDGSRSNASQSPDAPSPSTTPPGIRAPWWSATCRPPARAKFTISG